ncbi:hypothetical protein LTR62_003993 [Meristemomyces frigidus]|uniref:Histone chaperone domain-containing protein n=1 Tax=Meristemomyces frigidus TaxID=1508187 RepID=A0AAN7THV6_9PEZI|nr:hypothetical protein LTR62_003993 [Meristemomyces frigidus]
MSAQDIPSGRDSDNDYTSRDGQKQAPIPVQKDEDAVESGINSATEDSDAQLERDDKDAIDQSNVIDGGRTRGAAKKAGSYTEPDDEAGMPDPSDGTSRGATEGVQDSSTADAVQ